MRMKYTVVLIILFALCFALFAGCSKTQDNGVIELGAAGDGTGNASGGERPSGGGEMPSGMGEAPSGGGEMPSGGGETGGGGSFSGEAPSGADSTAGGTSAAGVAVGDDEVIGRVESIVGNRVTLLIGTSSASGITYGEDEEAYLLPVGMQIGTGDYSSVTSGMVLKLTMETLDDGTENITAVTIVSR